MIKRIFYFSSLLLAIVSMVSCSKDQALIDEAWVHQNDLEKMKIQQDPSFHALVSQTQKDYVYWKPNTFVPDGNATSLKITPDGTPYSTDSVDVRYIGWYYNQDHKEVIFDQTEGANNGVPRGFKLTAGGYGIIDGWSTMLQQMHVDDQVEVFIPYLLGYGSQAQTDGKGRVTIPAYTNLWFKIKLIKIIADNVNEYPKPNKK